MSKNRRKHPRVRARGLAAHLRTQHGRVACQVENVSMGGLFVRTDRLEEVGTELFVDIVKPGWKRQLTVTARTTSRVDVLDGRLSKRMPGMGLQFLQLDPKQHERLQSLLRELGVPESAGEATLAEDATELELRALELPESAAEPLDPQPPLWQVEDAIAKALSEADLAPPGPVVLDEEGPTAPTPALDLDLGASGDPGASGDAARLMLQIKGLVMQLSEVQQQVAQRDAEIARLREELETTRSALQRALRKS